MADSASLGYGFFAAFAVSGSVVLIARQVHKRLLSNFMKQIELELCGSKRCHQAKKRVRFADAVMEPSLNSKEYRRRYVRIATVDNQVLKTEGTIIRSEGVKPPEAMPVNWQNLYRGIIHYKNIKRIQFSM